LDKTRLTDALEENSTAVASLFLSNQDGIGKRLPEAIDSFINSINGSLTFRQKGISHSIKHLDDKIAREEIRISTLEDQLVRKFSSLEELVSRLKSQGDFLSQQASALQNFRRK
jgi:flagellar hook-associated protein 2